VISNGDNKRRGTNLIEYALEQTERAEPARPESSAGGLPADAIAGYTLLERLHRGGQGVVYKAIQDATNRAVAVKVLREGLLSEAVDRVRFQREIEVLSRLKHPNIVTLHDGGSADGFQFFVMDYIDGEPLDVHVRQRDLDVEATLRLFLKVCRAVSAAHLRGIIHRDLKPRNILVTDDGEPHILDFGLAKMTATGAASEQGGVTVTGQFIGSLPWASPEQAQGDSDGIDVRTDVHALGLILYHLLAGRTPFDVTGSMATTLRNIIEQEPAAPSEDHPGLDEELDIITLRCLAKDRDHRYQSVVDLARDIERYLAGEPIEAKRDSTWYVLTKTVRRHRNVAILLAALVVLTTVYAVTMTAMYRQAMVAERRAEQSAAAARNSFRKSQKAVELLINDVATGLRGVDGAETAQRMILEKAHEQLLELLDQRPDDPELRADYALTLRGLGDTEQALGRYEESFANLQAALEIQRHLAATYPDDLEHQCELSIGLVRVGDLAGLIGRPELRRKHYEQALAIDEALVAADPENLRFADNLIWSYERNGNLADLNRNFDVARDYYRKQLAAAEDLRERDPDNSNRLKAIQAAHGQLCQAASRAEQWADAVEHILATVEINEHSLALAPGDMQCRRRLASALLSVAPLLARLGRIDEAYEYVARGKELIDLMLEIDADRFENRYLLLRYHSTMANLASVTRDLEADELHSREAYRIVSGLALDRPNHNKTQAQLVAALRGLAHAVARRGDMAEARALSERGLSIAQRLVDESRATLELLHDYARLLLDTYPEDLRDPVKAVQIAGLAVTRTNHEDPTSLHYLARAHAASGRRDEAIETYKQALACPGVKDLSRGKTLQAELDAMLRHGTEPDQ